MTKKEIYENVKAILVKHSVKENVAAEILEFLEPKKGGQTVNIEDVVKRDIDGNIVEVQCKLSGVFLPATEEYFYNEKGSKIVGVDGFECSRTSKQAYKLKSDVAKAYKASKEAIMNDILEGNLTPDEAKESLAALPVEPDYSSVGLIVPEAE